MYILCYLVWPESRTSLWLSNTMSMFAPIAVYSKTDARIWSRIFSGLGHAHKPKILALVIVHDSAMRGHLLVQTAFCAKAPFAFPDTPEIYCMRGSINRQTRSLTEVKVSESRCSGGPAAQPGPGVLHQERRHHAHLPGAGALPAAVCHGGQHPAWA